MPELGEVRRIRGKACVYLSAWVGRPPVRRTGWCEPGLADGADMSTAAEQIQSLPDGTLLDVPMLAQGIVAIVNQPEQGAKLDDLTMLALEKEAEVARLEER